jgi:hypothetical protein
VSRNAQPGARCKRLELFLCLLLLPLRQLQAQLPGRFVDTNVPAARVVIVEDSLATDELEPVPEKIELMVDRGITNLTGKSTVRAAWNSLVSTNDTVGLKVFSSPGLNSGTRPAVVAAIVRDLIASGVPPRKIIVWDKLASDLRNAGYFDFEQRFGIRVEGALQAGFDTNQFYATALLGTLIWSDYEFGKTGTGIGRNSYVSKLVSKEITKIINITPLLHHNLMGVSGNLYSLALGSVDNTLRFEKESDALARAVPEIYALPVLGDRVVLNVVDALMCQYEGQQRGLLHYSTVLNQLWFSRDPVALDVLSLREINHERELAGALVNTNMDLFNNAALVEIGVSDTNRIKVNLLPSPQPARADSNPLTPTPAPSK